MSEGSTRSKWISERKGGAALGLTPPARTISSCRRRPVSDTDETFIVIEGDLRIDFRDGAVRVSAGEMFVVPKGVEHKPCAPAEVKLLRIEPRGVRNTGDEGGERVAANDAWI